MTREERLRILGPKTVAEIHRRVEAVPPPAPEHIELLRQMHAAAERAEQQPAA
jgi:hypothetical protein